MNSLIVIYLITYGLTVGGVVLGGFFLHLWKSSQQKNGVKISTQEITILIPFRNEENRLNDLLASILNSTQHPKKYVFIDDHSSDNSSELIKGQLGNLPFEIVPLSDQYSGKKQALRAVMEKCQTRYILTFDADISFHPNYFNSLEKLEEADMYVLPAILVGKSPMELFYELDVALANALNAGLSGVARPIFSSGANFLYKKAVFEEVDDLESHAHMASGDDTYLLRDFRNHQKDVRLESSLSVAVKTETPHSIKDFFDQRLRWVGKTTNVGDSLATVAAVGQFLFAIAFFGGLIYSAIFGNWFDFTVLLISKIGLDLIFFLPFFLRTKRFITWCLIPIYELMFPIYSMILGILLFTYQPKWKGREINRCRE